MSRHGQNWNMNMSKDGATMKLQGKGRIEFTDDDADVKALDPGGYFSFETGGSWLPWASSSRFVAERRGDGPIVRTYTVNGREIGADEGRKWLATALPDVVREFALAADVRVARLLAKGGPAAVLTEISRTKSSFAKATYFRELFAQGRLDAATTARSLRQAGAGIDSSFELAGVLKAAAKRGTLDAITAPAFTEAAQHIDSDFELHHALGAALAQPGIDAQAAVLIVRAGKSVDSDFEQASLLVEVPPALIEGIGPPYFEALATVGSDFERRRVLSALAGRPNLKEATQLAAIEATTHMGSDFERASALVALARGQRLESRARGAALASAREISSEFERGRALSALGEASSRISTSR